MILRNNRVDTSIKFKRARKSSEIQTSQCQVTLLSLKPE